ncbi:MAG TPA: histidine kinase [Brevundimonas sp.]|nr:histidine kinase [Brevundimonas sp.]
MTYSSDMKLTSDPRGQAMLVAAVIWAVDAPLILAPAMAAGNVTIGGLTQAAVIVIGGWLLCLAVFQVLHLLRRANARTRIAGVGVAVVAAALTLGLVDGVAVILLGLTGVTPKVGTEALMLRGLSNTIFLAWMFTLFASVILLLNSNRRVAEREADLAHAELQAAQAQSAASAARLAALRYQLNPHFLFNTLNAVSAAVVTRRNDEAEAMLARLADFLRATLSADPAAEVRLEEELGTVEAYLEIESERFRDRLSVVVNCPDRLRGALVPSFILQPLIENTIKHGVSRSKSRVSLKVSAKVADDALMIHVDDDAKPLKISPVPEGGGIGLAAVRDRLDVLYGARGGLTTARLDPGFRTSLHLPLKLADRPEEA